MNSRLKNSLLLIVKALVSFGLIWYLLSDTEFSEIYISLKSANLYWLLLSFVTLNIGKFLTGYRWQVLLRAQGIEISIGTLIASVFVGQFFNSFLPTTVGGDAMRAYDTAAQSKETMKAVISVFADRLIGVFALALLAIVALVFGFFTGAEIGFYTLPILMVFFLCSFGMLLIYYDALITWAVRIIRKVRLIKLADKLEDAYKSLHSLKDHPVVMIQALVLSILLQINVVLFYYFIGLALGLSVSLLYFTMIVPITLVVLLVPFSINGIGIREGIFVFLLTGLGVQSRDAIALSLISFGLMLTQGIIGGALFALRGINQRQIRQKTNLPDHSSQ